jgi:hypothetical protein
LAFAHDGDVVDDDRGKGFVARVTLYAGDGGNQQGGVRVALAEDGVLAVELWDIGLGYEELGAVGAAARGARACIGHGEEAGLVEGEGGVDLVLEEVAWVAGTIAHAVAALDHEVGDDAMEGGAVVVGLVVHLLEGFGVGPVLGAVGQADEVGYGDGGFFFVEFAGEAAHGGVDDSGGTGGYDGGLHLAGGAGCVWKSVGWWGGGRLRLGGYGEAQGECECAKHHAVCSSNRQAIADGRLEQCEGLRVAGVW